MLYGVRYTHTRV